VSITDLKLELVCLKKRHNRISNQFLDALESAGYDVKSSAEVSEEITGLLHDIQRVDS
jgi:hypothetical protein